MNLSLNFKPTKMALCCLFLQMSCASAPATKPQPITTDSDKLVDDAPFSGAPSRSSFSPLADETPQYPSVKPVQAPKTQAGARRALQKGLHAMQKEDFALAAAYFDAVLAADLLTESGRMNLYWMTAESHEKVHSQQGERWALGSFILLAQVLHDDDPRITQAYDRLRALKIKNNLHLGRSAQHAIVVKNAHEPASIMAALCDGFLAQPQKALQEKIQSSPRGKSRFLKRSRQCPSGKIWELWFSVPPF